MRASVVKTDSGLISSAGAANIADGFLNNSSCFPEYFHGYNFDSVYIIIANKYVQQLTLGTK